MKKKVFLGISHIVALGLGFVLGVYFLPILTAPDSPSVTQVEAAADNATYNAIFKRGLKGNDAFHWGEGKVYISEQTISFQGELAPGPDYKLYLVPQFVEDAAEFLAVKERAVMLGDIKTFDAFIVSVPDTVDLAQYDTVLVWCESFSKFITAAKFR